MRAAYYESVGSASDVVRVGERATPRPQAGEVRIRVHTSGVNPSDVKARAGARGPLTYPYVIPHSDGAGVIESIGEWCRSRQARRARLDLERRLETAVRHLRRVCLLAIGTGGGPSAEHRFRRGRLLRNSRNDRLPRGTR